MLVSVLIPCYNSKTSIKSTIDSVLAQDYTNIEVIINDDCSTDGTYEYIRDNFGNYKNIKLYQNAKNLGMCGNWNVLFGLANGDYWLKLDADDLIANDFVSTCTKQAQKTNADFIGTSYRFLNTHTKESNPVYIHGAMKDGLLKSPLKSIFIDYPFHLCFTLLKADFVKKISTEYYFMETEVGDAEFQIRAALTPGFKAYFINKEKGYYCFHGANSSLTPLKQARSFIYDVVKKHHINLKKALGHSYQKKMSTNFSIYFKDMIRNRAPWDFKLLLTCLKYRLF